MARASPWRVVAVLATAAAALAVAADKAPAANEQELRELRGRITKMQAELAAAEKSSGAASEELRASAKAVSEAHRALFALAQERRTIEAEVAALSARERDARSGVAVQEELAGRMLRIQYRQGPPDRLRLAQKALPFLGPGVWAGQQHLQCDGAIEAEVPAGKIRTYEAIMYPDLNDWVRLGAVLETLAKPLLPKRLLRISTLRGSGL